MADPADEPGALRRRSAPEYKVYGRAAGSARPAAQARPVRSSARASCGAAARRGPSRSKPPTPPGERPLWRRVAEVGRDRGARPGSLISFLAFAISAQIQKGKLADGVDNVLDGGPFLLGGADDPRARHRRALGRLRRPGRGERRELHRGGQQRRAAADTATPYRSDTIMLVRAGGGTFRKLSIPRDTLADDPRPAASRRSTPPTPSAARS